MDERDVRDELVAQVVRQFVGVVEQRDLARKDLAHLPKIGRLLRHSWQACSPSQLPRFGALIVFRCSAFANRPIGLPPKGDAMQGVIIAPILAAILAVLVTGKPWAGAAAFVVVLALAATGVVSQFRRHD